MYGSRFIGSIRLGRKVKMDDGQEDYTTTDNIRLAAT